MTHDLSHDLTFYSTHNQLCVPQYKINVQSTWEIKLWPSTQHRHYMCGWTYLSFCPSTENKQNQCVLDYWYIHAMMQYLYSAWNWVSIQYLLRWVNKVRKYTLLKYISTYCLGFCFVKAESLLSISIQQCTVAVVVLCFLFVKALQMVTIYSQVFHQIDETSGSDSKYCFVYVCFLCFLK